MRTKLPVELQHALDNDLVAYTFDVVDSLNRANVTAPHDGGDAYAAYVSMLRSDAAYAYPDGVAPFGAGPELVTSVQHQLDAHR